MTEQALRKMIASTRQEFKSWGLPAVERPRGEKCGCAGKERSSDGKENGRRCIGSFEYPEIQQHDQNSCRQRSLAV